MKYIKIAPNQEIILKANENAPLSYGLREAIEFCKENKTKQCDLQYGAFTFDIDKHSNINQKVMEYSFWRSFVDKDDKF